MLLSLLHVSDNDKHFSSAIDEYLKRLGKTVRIKTIKPVKHGTHAQIIQKETEAIKKKLDVSRRVIVLNPEGSARSTDDWVKNLEATKAQLVIGGPYGLDYSEFADAKHVSMGAQTMPHGLAKLVVLEQVYRVSCIVRGKKYHW